MAVIEGGVSAALAEVGAAAAQPMHVVEKPDSYGALGHYSMSTVTGTIAAGLAAGSDIWQLRWVDATRLCVIYRVLLEGAYQLTGFTAGAGLFNLTVARSFTVDGTGGGAATLTFNNQKDRTSMGSSLMGTIRTASTVALGPGTKTYDAQDIGKFPKFIPAAANSQLFDQVPLFDCGLNGQHPIVLAQNEGLGIRATVPATGTWVIGIRVRWSELSAY